MPRALLSVSDKTGLVEFAPRALPRAASSWCPPAAPPRPAAGRACRSSPISDVTGFPEMMDGRVKTLHPLVHGGILARRVRARRPRRRPAQHGITLIDLVVVNLYPFVSGRRQSRHAVRRADRGDRHRRAEPGARRRQELPATCSSSSRRPTTTRVLEQLDRAGGPTLGVPFRAGAQGVRPHRRATTRRSPRRWPRSRTRRRLHAARRRGSRRRRLRVGCGRCGDLRYGENPHQAAAWYAPTARRAGFGARAAAAGQGALVHQPARSRCGGAHRARVRRAGRGGDQAHESVRRGDRARAADAYVRARDADRARRRSAASSALNRAIDAEAARAIVVDVHRCGDRARR